MSNPYLITGPALISFSGGRTSAYMLRMILDAHGGTLPDDVHVCFANTGKEREETLRFVHECATRWGVRVRWLEWRAGEPSFAEVAHNSASRDGEPFAALIAKYGYPPTPMGRFCTSKLKVETMKRFMMAQGHSHWKNAVGLRADEMLRVFRQIERNDSGKERWTAVMPLANAKVRRAHVAEFWEEQPFDLGLNPGEGNCDLCFMKGGSLLKRLIRDDVDRARWWTEQEGRSVARVASRRQFRPEYSYADLVHEVAASPLLPLENGDDDEFDAECGLWCAGDAA